MFRWLSEARIWFSFMNRAWSSGSGQAPRHHLGGDGKVGPAVLREEDDAHPSLAEDAGDDVVVEFGRPEKNAQLGTASPDCTAASEPARGRRAASGGADEVTAVRRPAARAFHAA